MAVAFALLVVLLVCLPSNLLIPCSKRKKVIKSKGRHSAEESNKRNVNAGNAQDEHNLRNRNQEKLSTSATGPSSKDSGRVASPKHSQKSQKADDSDPLKSAPLVKKTEAPRLASKKESCEEKTDLRSLPSESEAVRVRRTGDGDPAKPDDNAQTAMPGKPQDDNAATAMPGKVQNVEIGAPAVVPGKLITCEDVAETQIHHLPMQSVASDQKNQPSNTNSMKHNSMKSVKKAKTVDKTQKSKGGVPRRNSKKPHSQQQPKPKQASAEVTQSEKEDDAPKKAASPHAVAPVTMVLPAPTQAAAAPASPSNPAPHPPPQPAHPPPAPGHAHPPAPGHAQPPAVHPPSAPGHAHPPAVHPPSAPGHAQPAAPHPPPAQANPLPSHGSHPRPPSAEELVSKYI